MKIVFRHVAAVLTAVFLTSVPAIADTIPVPSQDEWVSAKKYADLPDGTTLSYVEIGPQEGEPVLLLHGYTDNSRSWSLLAPYLEGRRLIAVDLRGHGNSDAPACCYGVDVLANDVSAFMDVLGLQKADIIGHSMGSMTGLTLAAFYPDKVDKLVLISFATEIPDAASDWLWENLPGMSRPIDPESEFMLSWYWNPTPVDEAFLSRERAESAAAPEAAWMGVLRGLTLVDLTKTAQKVKAPVLILWGDQDALFTPDSQPAVKALFPTSKYVTFPGRGHNMFWEVPADVAKEIKGFLAE